MSAYIIVSSAEAAQADQEDKIILTPATDLELLLNLGVGKPEFDEIRELIAKDGSAIALPRAKYARSTSTTVSVVKVS